jgi:hypothetical protein
MSLRELKREIEDGMIVAVWTAIGERMTREELVGVAMLRWEQAVIEEALGEDAARVLPEAIRLMELRARVPLSAGCPAGSGAEGGDVRRCGVGSGAGGCGVGACGGVGGGDAGAGGCLGAQASRE